MDDWRLMGQDKYLRGRRLTLRTWWPLREGGGHDHCAFCQRHLSVPLATDDLDAVDRGYVTEGSCHWVCGTCFDYFREQFGWTTGEGTHRIVGCAEDSVPWARGCERGLTPGELMLLGDAETDAVSLGGVLIDLGLCGNRANSPQWRPEARHIDAAFHALGRLHERGLIEVGRIEYVDVGCPGRSAPVRHVARPLSIVRERVEAAIASVLRPTDWEFACWVVATNGRSH